MAARSTKILTCNFRQFLVFSEACLCRIFVNLQLTGTQPRKRMERSNNTKQEDCTGSDENIGDIRMKPRQRWIRTLTRISPAAGSAMLFAIRMKSLELVIA